ncbi:MAG: M18 family aminopeptidase [Myxococcota bacterium]|nr:M18 family aminopeptidase [Myxococcota bacterium]
MDRADDYIEFSKATPTPFHAVREITQRLERDGFLPIEPNGAWSFRGGERHYVIAPDQRTVIAFAVGHKAPSEAGFRILGSHTDAPDLRLKLNPVSEGCSVTRLHTQIHGGVLYRTWLDRPLDLGGMIYHLKRDSDGRVQDDPETGLPALERHLVRANKPIAFIPELAIHLDRKVNSEGKINPEEQLVAVLGSGEQDPLLAQLSELLGHDLRTASGFDLHLFPFQDPVRVGVDGSIILGPRHDDLAMCWASCEALRASVQQCPDSDRTRVGYFVDAEEVGSMTSSGAQSSFLRHTLLRITRQHAAYGESGHQAEAAFQASLVVSADMAHAQHPNHPTKHAAGHAPQINHGITIKTNANERYASTGETSALFRGLCEKAGVAFQEFVTRQDMGCGSTIGPIVAAGLGARTVDVGIPMWGMHSTFESCGVDDLNDAVLVFTQHYSS